MLHTFRATVSAAIRWSGVSFLVRHTLARRRATILYYHDPRPDVLELHLRYLSRRYTFISLSELVDAIHAGTWERIPDRALVITLDDGHRGNAELLEVFARHGVVPTIYLTSQVVATLRRFWFLSVPDPNPLKRLPSERRRVELARVGFVQDAEGDGAGRQALSQDELEQLSAFVEYGAHTRFHPVLPACSNAECTIEIAGSKEDVESMVDRQCVHFSYPNGDYGLREIRAVRAAGFRSARTDDIGWNSARTDPFRLKVLGTTDTASVTRLAADLSGIPGYLSRLRTGSVRGRHRPVASS